MKPSTARVLRALQAAGDRGCTTHDLCAPDVGGVRFSARVLELRDAGYRITETRIRQGSHRYTLHADARQGVGAGSGSPAGKPDVLPLTGWHCLNCWRAWDGPGDPPDVCPPCPACGVTVLGQLTVRLSDADRRRLAAGERRAA